MSRGISIYYKLLNSDENKLTYGYSGADISKKYDKNSLLAYDGIIEITISALESKTSTEAIKDNTATILKECIYEWHQPRLTDGDRKIGFFAVNVISKIFREYKENKQIAEKGCVVY